MINSFGIKGRVPNQKVKLLCLFELIIGTNINMVLVDLFVVST